MTKKARTKQKLAQSEHIEEIQNPEAETSLEDETVMDENIETEGDDTAEVKVRASGPRGALLVGIDLGTCRTAASSNRGARLMVRSVVGYPKDIISRKMVGKGPIFGKAAIKKRNFLNLCFPLADGVIQEANARDYKAAKELVTFVIEQAKQGEDLDVHGVIGIPARASIANKELLLRIAGEMMSLSLVVSEPFMVAYQMDKLDNCIVIDIGAGTVDICGMKGTIPAPEDQVTMLKGGDFIDERLAAAIARRYHGVQITRSVACGIKEAHSFVGEPEEPVIVTLRADGKPMQYDVTDEIRSVCESIVPDIVEHIETVIMKFDPEQQEETLKNIILAGGGSHIRGLDAMIEEQLQEYGDIEVTCVEDPDFVGSAGALQLAEEVPVDQWHELGLMSET
ncbi:MAG: rod shape-determining protein [Desulfobulbaceae bacterium]|nr:rod shape-determining protein [Desulfobulbaceae bacterium]